MQRLGSIADVAGVKLGHALTPSGRSGCTVIDFPEGAVAGIDVRGGGAGTRQTDSLRAYHTVQRVDAICLSGGSAMGLGCAQGVVDAMREAGRGYDVRGHRVPIVPAAILFDLFVSNGEIPGPAEGRAAWLAAGRSDAMGSVGAGAGASVGKWFGLAGAMRGGLGMMSARFDDVTVAVLAVVNAFGDVVDEHGAILAGARAEGGGFADSESLLVAGAQPAEEPYAAHTNLVVAATDARLGREEVRHFAALAHDGVTRSVRPAHLTFDGDVCFGAATGLRDTLVPVERLGVLAGRLMERAVREAVRRATALPGLPAAAVEEKKS